MYQSFVSHFLQPFTLLYLLTALALVNLWRKRRETRKGLRTLTLPFVVLTVLCLPAVGYLALGSLEWQYPPLEERPADIEAIVVLSGGVYPPDAARARAEMASNTIGRCLKAAELYRQGKACPVLVSGGKSDPEAAGPAYAEVMRDFLVQLGVHPSDLIVEGQSSTTYENAVESRKLLEARGLHKVVLVTDATHLVRAQGCFRKQGIETVPCGCGYRATSSATERFNLLPDARAARDCQIACHEWLGAAWYWLCGRM